MDVYNHPCGVCFSRAGLSGNYPGNRLDSGSAQAAFFQREAAKVNFREMEMLCRFYRTGKITRALFVLQWALMQKEAAKCTA